MSKKTLIPEINGNVFYNMNRRLLFFQFIYNLRPHEKKQPHFIV
jgi:hypothetical protein